MTGAECVAGSVRDLLSSTLMTRRKKHGWLKTMLGLMLGCMLVVVAVFAATNVATIATTKDRIVEPQAAVGFDADAIVVLGASVFADGTPCLLYTSWRGTLLGTDPVEGVSMIADASAKAAHLRTMSTLVVPCVVASLEA